MKKHYLFITLILIFAAVAVLVWTKPVGAGKERLVSPQLILSKTLGLNQWFPKMASSSGNLDTITSKAAIFLDTKTGEVLYAKNIHQKLPIASLVKVMTSLAALDYKDFEDKFIVSQQAANMEPDKMLLLPGEKLSLKELLEGLFLVSANDAAEVIAEGTIGSRDEFIKIMNQKARQVGMENSYFANPTGLDEDQNNSYSTAYDLALLTRYAIRKYPSLVDITKKEHIYIPETNEHQYYDLYSGINLLTTYPGVVGFKTGFTPQAGLTLITLARRDGHEIIGVLLGSENRREEAKELLDFSFSKILKE